jgi:hypothetical protein
MCLLHFFKCAFGKEKKCLSHDSCCIMNANIRWLRWIAPGLARLETTETVIKLLFNVSCLVLLIQTRTLNTEPGTRNPQPGTLIKQIRVLYSPPGKDDSLE